MSERVRAERARWWVAYRLDRLPFLCWADLVTWALGWTRLRDSRRGALCVSDAALNGRCYCSKTKCPPADHIDPPHRRR